MDGGRHIDEVFERLAAQLGANTIRRKRTAFTLFNTVKGWIVRKPTQQKAPLIANILFQAVAIIGYDWGNTIRVAVKALFSANGLSDQEQAEMRAAFAGFPEFIALVDELSATSSSLRLEQRIPARSDVLGNAKAVSKTLCDLNALFVVAMLYMYSNTPPSDRADILEFLRQRQFDQGLPQANSTKPGKSGPRAFYPGLYQRDFHRAFHGMLAPDTVNRVLDALYLVGLLVQERDASRVSYQLTPAAEEVCAIFCSGLVDRARTLLTI